MDVGLERAGDVPLAGREPLHAGQRLVTRALELLVVELLGEVGVGVDDGDGRRGAHAADSYPDPVTEGVRAMPVALRLDDPDGEFAAVRLASDLHLSDAERRSRATATAGCSSSSCRTCCGSSTSSRSTTPDGGTERILDPGNDEARAGRVRRQVRARAAGLRAAGVAGRPRRVAGRYDEVEVRGRGLGANVAVRVWSPADAAARPPLRLLLANDGPEYDELASLTGWAGAMIAAGRAAAVPGRAAAARRPQQLVLGLGGLRARARHTTRARAARARGVDRRAGRAWARASARSRCCTRTAATRGAFGGAVPAVRLVLHPALRRAESGLRRFARITRFVRDDAAATAHYAIPVPVDDDRAAREEENAANNRAMARCARRARDTSVSLEEVLDMHNYIGWRDAFDPHLTTLLRRAWTR